MQIRVVKMILLQIKNTKEFMSKLLASEVFDAFYMESAKITTANTYTIDGTIHKEFFGKEGESEAPTSPLSSWADMKSVCYNIIKGKHTPLGFTFILCASDAKKEELLVEADSPEALNAVSSLVFIIRFQDGAVTITTGTALSGFTLDKSYEKIWDEYVKAFLDSNSISYEEA